MRLILKEMSLGVGPNTILKVFHPKALDWYNSTSSLQTVCMNALIDQRPRKEDEQAQGEDSNVEIVPDRPIRPMLANRVTWNDIDMEISKSPPKTWSSELKFDGERCLIHKFNGQVKLWSRQQVELSKKYPDYLMALRGYIDQCIHADNYIIDGELLSWSNQSNGYLPFGMNRSVASGKIAGAHLCYQAFDIVYLNGAVIIDRSLRERQAILAECISDQVVNVFSISKSVAVGDVHEVISFLDAAVNEKFG
jgi:ATP-dependent DNA ligase